ncbi:MAG: hypothetical protein KA198_05335 [Chitinophagaceae bacterium]|nr:hypothetical protein [Chitinophagaceae bacterium]
MKKFFQNRDKVVLLLLILGSINAFILFMMTYMVIPCLEDFGKGLPIIDIRFTGYTYPEMLVYLRALGEPGIDMYLHQLMPLDLIFPLSYAAFLAVLLHALHYFSFFRNTISKALWQAPFYVAGFDYLENLCVWGMLIQYPHLNADLVAVSSFITLFKWFLMLITLTAVTYNFYLLVLGLLLKKRYNIK